MKPCSDIKVRVGILTDGIPAVRGRIVGNALMGIGFHWRRRYQLLLPADAVVVDGKGPLVVDIPLETYLMSVVGSEMNPDSPLEFMRAHAIVSRSWVAGKILSLHREERTGAFETDTEIRTWADTAAHSGFHVCSDDHCQRYQGEQPLGSRVAGAVRDTAGMVLVDDRGGVIDARFSKCCGGRTELFSSCWQDVDYPWLQSVADPWCDPSVLAAHERRLVERSVLKEYDAAATPAYYRWEEIVSGKTLGVRLRSRFDRDIGPVTGLRVMQRGPSGRIFRLGVSGPGGRVIIGKELAVRRLLGATHLLSSAVDISSAIGVDGDTQFRLRGRGWGHGVGLCQIGAAVMALRGLTARQILEHYYPGARMASLDWLRITGRIKI